MEERGYRPVADYGLIGDGHTAALVASASGELLGNFPQGFSHLALIRSALNISRCEASGAEERAATSAERADETERAARSAEESNGRG